MAKDGDQRISRSMIIYTTRYGSTPVALRRLVTPVRLAVAMQFMRFGAVGVMGLIIDTMIVYGLRREIGLYGAGLLAYLVAASCNWLLNRVWTFRGNGSGPAHRQWAKFMIANLAGFALNRGAYVTLVTFSAAAAAQPIIATSAGSLAGMAVNFNLSRRLVFR